MWIIFIFEYIPSALIFTQLAIWLEYGYLLMATKVIRRWEFDPLLAGKTACSLMVKQRQFFLQIMIGIILSIIIGCILGYLAYFGKNEFLSKICLCICLAFITYGIVDQVMDIFNSEYHKIMWEYSKNIFPYIFEILIDFAWLAITCVVFYLTIKRIVRPKGGA